MPTEEVPKIIKPSPPISSSCPPMALEITTDDRLPLSNENGFPVGPLSFSSSSFDDCGGERRGDPQIEALIASTSDFASDFYRCKTDWSSLLEEPAVGKEMRGLVQRDLFRMWGIKKPADGWGSRSGFGDSYPSRKRRRTMMGGAGGGDRVDQEI
ncbi:putative DNA cross-link repair protein SNM1 [Cocos nucifera]|nr:putative DNA cross-link repair protein SNM1 [Cocos nucifera]